MPTYARFGREYSLRPLRLRDGQLGALRAWSLRAARPDPDGSVCATVAVSKVVRR